MSVFIFGFLLFIVAFFIHVAIWRIKKPANTIKALVVFFNLVLVLGLILLRLFAYIYPGLSIIPYRSIDYTYIALLFLSLFICYLLSYSAIEADSPSLVIAMRVFQSGKNGLHSGRMKELLGDDLLVGPRLKDLVDAKLVDLAGSVYKINKKGIFFIKPFVAFRKFLILGKGG